MGCTSCKLNQEAPNFLSTYPITPDDNTILLLGTGQGGKTTFLRQVLNKHKNFYTEEFKYVFRIPIKEGVIKSVATIFAWNKTLHEEGVVEATIDQKYRQFYQKISAPSFPSDFDEHCGEKIEELWRSDAGFRETFANRSHFNLPGSPNYYFENAGRLGLANYRPTMKDILYYSNGTIGAQENFFTAENVPYKMIDVGGKRIERKNWARYLNGIDSVIFFVSLEEYDMFLAEQPKMPRHEESLIIFHEIVNSGWFEDSMMVIFFNKVDLFRKKVKIKPIRKYFPSYSGDDADAEASMEHIKNTFLLENLNRNREVHWYYTNAMDEEIVTGVFKDVLSKLRMHVVYTGRNV